MNRLKELRKAAGITLRKLDEETGINYSSLGQIEKDNRNLTQEHIFRLCDFFNVTADFLLGKTNFGYRVLLANHYETYVTLSEEDYRFYRDAGEIKEYVEFHHVLRIPSESLSKRIDPYREKTTRELIIEEIEKMDDEKVVKVYKFIKEIL